MCRFDTMEGRDFRYQLLRQLDLCFRAQSSSLPRNEIGQALHPLSAVINFPISHALLRIVELHGEERCFNTPVCVLQISANSLFSSRDFLSPLLALKRASALVKSQRRMVPRIRLNSHLPRHTRHKSSLDARMWVLRLRHERPVSPPTRTDRSILGVEEGTIRPFHSESVSGKVVTRPNFWMRGKTSTTH